MTRSSYLPAVLSLFVPGLGQLYNGERAKAIAIICMDLGIGIAIALAIFGPARMRSWSTVVILAMVYLFVWIPAIVDAHQQALGVRKSLLSGDQAWYVIVMLLAIGPGAIPFLWQSPRFSRAAKIIWTLVVTLIFVGGILLLLFVMPLIEERYKELFEIMGTLS